jgi:signal transduction histidine kinase
LSLSAPDRVRYRYLLDGYDREWSATTSAREASYTNLAPRTYRFRVVGSNPDGVWSRDEATLDFTVDPLFWQTWWFGSASVIGFALVAAACYRLRLNYLTQRLNAQFEERLVERVQVARDLHDTLLQTIQGSKLVADNALAGRADETRMRNALEKVSTWLAQANQEGRLALNSLRSSTTQRNDLAEALRRAGDECRMQRSIEFRFSVEGATRPMHPIVRDEVYRIAYEAIRNACSHSGASHLDVELSYVRSLLIRVRDDGMGIPPEVAVKGKEGRFGIIGMHERAARLQARLLFSSPRGVGAEVELVVPEKIAFPQSKSTPPRGLKMIKRLFG